MSSILIAYYSRSGTTRQVARQLADKLGADLYAIQDARPRRGLFGYLQSALEAMRGSLPDIKPCTTPLSQYDMVVLGTPVWMGHLASPMRRFLHDKARYIRQAAFFCTMGGEGADTVFGEMEKLLCQDARATLALRQDEVMRNACQAQIAGFAADIAHAPRRPAFDPMPLDEDGTRPWARA
ncbi:flavodoxin [Dyella sp. BiH032]|uniref:flavodoxin family protein n=1 Tax=Dyella sp. BiH032 TaxID=3075430 RepID=UPI0028933EAF|nr:flavodoxin [Dyella sp. BiH032]WNL44056.1 flavodoxin [Dyella sp. BiH032]